MASYFINLDRRTDRKESFYRKYELFGPKIPLVRVEAIDGTKKDALNNEYNKYISSDNDFNGNPRIIATIMSHIKTWELIANGDHEYGLVFEDDVLFREDGYFRRNFKDVKSPIVSKLSKLYQKTIEKELLKMISKVESPFIIYFGASDVLPIHVPIASDSLFRAVEKSHVQRETIVYEYFGEQRSDTTSPYIFDWIGAFSYILPKFVAKYLLEVVSKAPVGKAVDLSLIHI
jgi:GR25 family glycosyltransferase involved in LPS biosynthesis